MIRAAVLVIAALGAAGTSAADVVVAKGGVLRLLDKLSGVVTDYTLATGQTQTEGRLTVRLDECRYPSDLPTGEAYAHLTVTEAGTADPVFKGWMVATSPGLSSLDHPRYDVWVLRCDVPTAPAGATSTGNTSGG